jgi:hypothetical protein
MESAVVVMTTAPTLNGCCTCGAAPYCVFPAWLASILQVPEGDTKLDVAPAMWQPDVEEWSMEKVTGLPEAPPVAETT